MPTVENWVFLLYGDSFFDVRGVPKANVTSVSNGSHQLNLRLHNRTSRGSVLVNRLSEEYATVLLVEAGEDQTNQPMYDIPFNAAAAQQTSADWQYKTVPQNFFFRKRMIEQRSLWPRGRGSGGTTFLNGLIYFRASRYDYDGWAANGCTNWGYDDILPYFFKSEDMCSSIGIDPGK